MTRPRSKASAARAPLAVAPLAVALLAAALATSLAAGPPDFGALDCRLAPEPGDDRWRCRFVGADGAARPLFGRPRLADDATVADTLRWRVTARGPVATDAIEGVFNGTLPWLLTGRGGLALVPMPGADAVSALALSAD